MTYIFKNTERNNEKASVFETKSLLYLIGQNTSSKHIEYVTFYCFNDVSGINKKFDKIWDIQSKNEKSLNPKKIGYYFFTLFDNYISSFNFHEYIFFCPILKSAYKNDDSTRIYKTDNIKDDTFLRIKKGLTEKVERVFNDGKNYESDIDSFLKEVIIVEDSIEESEYIKNITKFKNKELKPEDFYKSVFNDLRNLQSGKKNTYIENATITEIKEVLNFKRHLTAKDIDKLIISRIIGVEFFSHKSIPLYFSNVIDGLEIEEKRDIVLECKANLAKAFFNKNSNKHFWEICELIIDSLVNDFRIEVELIHENLFNTYNIKISYFNENTLKYLIAIIIEGLEP